MKKYLSLLAFAALLIAGCAKEPKSAFADGDSFTTEFTVAMDAVNTRAVADNDGAAALVDECLIQIWMDVDGTYELYSTPAVTALDNLHYTFTATFIKNQNYKILVWADKSGFYTFADDATVSRNDLTVDNEDGLDAFYANVDIDASAPITNKTITARRPFAQLNVITTDLQKIPADFIPEFVSISYDAPASMNLLDETLGADSTFVIANSPVYFEGTTGVAAKSTLSMDYIFAPVDREVKNFVYSIAYTVPIDREFNNIPLQRNYRTNILGNLLSVDEEFLVIVDPIWNEPDYVISDFMVNDVAYETIEDAFAAAAPGDTLHINTNGSFAIPASLKGFTIDATGYNVSFSTTSTITAEDMTFNNVTISAPNTLTATSGAITTKGTCAFNDCTFRFFSKYGIVPSGKVDFTGCDWVCEGKSRGIMVWGGAPEINVDDCTFDCTYPFNCDGGTPVFNVVGSTLNGWTSYTSTATASFEDCSFGLSTSGYAFCRPYADATFTNCEFSEEFLVDFGQAGLTFTMNDCTQNGAVVTTFVVSPDTIGGTIVIDGVSYEVGPYDAASSVDELIAAVDAFNAKTDAGEVEIVLAAGTYEAKDIVVYQNVTNKSLKIVARTPGSVTMKLAADSQSNSIFAIAGESNFSNPESVTIEGIKFDFSALTLSKVASAVYFCAANEPYLPTGTSHRYGHNLIINNCEFIGEDTENSMLFTAAQNTSPNHMTVNGCTVKNAGYITSGYGSDLVVKNTVVENCKAAINLQNVGLTVEDCEFNTYHDYCIRTNGGPVVVKNTVFDCEYAGDDATSGIIVLRGTETCEATISGNTITKASSAMNDVYCKTAWTVNGTAQAANTPINF